MTLKRRLINFAIQHKYLSLLFILCIVWGLAAIGLYGFESASGRSSYRNLGDAFRAIAICLTSGFDIDAPITTGALVIAILALVCGVITVGGLIACLTSDLVNRIFFGLKIPVKSAGHTLEGHIILFGWSDKADRVIRELHAEVLPTKKPIVVVTDEEERLPLPDPTIYESVWTVYGSPTSSETLKRADVAAADTAIILADENEAEPDSKSLLVCLAVESYNPDVYTCVELKDERNRRHFARVNANELVNVGDISENLLAQAAISKGISDVLYELLTFQVNGNELYIVSPPSALVAEGRTFGEIAKTLQPHRILAVGIQEGPQRAAVEHFALQDGQRATSSPGRIALNPPYTQVLAPDQNLLVLAYSKPDLDSLPNL